MITEQAMGVMRELATISEKGPLASKAVGSTGVGITLLDQLGLPLTSSGKATYKGIVIKTRRSTSNASETRVNLFARVPTWASSACKSSEEIMERYGYFSEEHSNKRLYCTVSARRVNPQGLVLVVDRYENSLHEVFRTNGFDERVEGWVEKGVED